MQVGGRSLLYPTTWPGENGENGECENGERRVRRCVWLLFTLECLGVGRFEWLMVCVGRLECCIEVGLAHLEDGWGGWGESEQHRPAKAPRECDVFCCYGLVGVCSLASGRSPRGWLAPVEAAAAGEKRSERVTLCFADASLWVCCAGCWTLRVVQSSCPPTPPGWLAPVAEAAAGVPCWVAGLEAWF